MNAAGSPLAVSAVPVSTVELSRVRIPLRNPLRSARVHQADRESILIRLVALDGVEGYSECPTLTGDGYVTETTDTAWNALVGELVPAVLSRRSPSVQGAPAASAALADARLDSDLRRGDRSMSQWLGERTGMLPRPGVAWCAVLTDVLLEPHEAAALVSAAVVRGARSVKLKMQHPGLLSEIIERVRAETDVPLCADANGSLRPDEVADIDDLGLAYIEQPLPAGTPWEELASLREQVRSPIALDESLVSLDALHDGVRAGAFDIASIKPSRIGGCLAAARAIRLCVDSDVECFVGGMFELGVGRAAALGVASLSGCSLPTDLGPTDRYFETDVCEAFETDDAGLVSCPSGPGIGRIPDPRAVEAHLVDRVVLGSARIG